MFGTEAIRSINDNNALRKRALAYAQNHPGVDVTEATMILAQRDAQASVKKARVARVKKSHAKPRCCP